MHVFLQQKIGRQGGGPVTSSRRTKSWVPSDVSPPNILLRGT